MQLSMWVSMCIFCTWSNTIDYNLECRLEVARKWDMLEHSGAAEEAAQFLDKMVKALATAQRSVES